MAVIATLDERPTIFGKTRWFLTGSEAALNAGKSRLLTVSDAQVDNYGPFVRLHLENRAAETIRIILDATVLGDDSISQGTLNLYVKENTAVDISPYIDGRPDFVFKRVLIQNTHASGNTSADEIKWEIRNW